MPAAEQLDLARNISEGVVDHRIQRQSPAVRGQRADLEKIELPIVTDGKFHVD